MGDERHANSNNRSTVGRFVRKGQRADKYFEELFKESSEKWRASDGPMGTPADYSICRAERFASEWAWLDFGEAVKTNDRRSASTPSGRSFKETKSESSIIA
jgi:hypothetical protein